jgi:3-hydroxybutyrate dehydrogenase
MTNNDGAGTGTGTRTAPAAAGFTALAGKAAVVTGAASGIGRAVAERFSELDMQVLSVDLEADPATPGIPFGADLSTPEGNESAVAEALSRFGRLDVVVANAGLQHVAPVEEFPLERWQALVSLMLTSPFLLAKHAWPALRASGSGRFLVIASVHGLVASPYKVAYVSAKHGAIGLVKTLALEGAADGIRAVAICPGYVRTPLVEAQMASQAEAHGVPEERVLEEVILEPHVIKELIEPGEVAELAVFLAGPAGRAFTGVAVTMDQGWSAR